MRHDPYKPARALFAAILLTLPTHLPAQAGDREEEIRTVISSLEAAWNAGDMDRYLATYRPDESMSLTYGNTVVQGWDALDRLFRSSYPDEERMGKFTIDSIAITLLGEDAALAYGNFTHVFVDETVVGGYSHVLTRENDGAWLIQHERTSRGEVSAAE